MMTSAKKRVLLIGNPIAGRGRSERSIDQFVRKMRERGCEIEMFLTKLSGDAKHRAQRIEPDIETLIVAGGDGTLNEVVNGLSDPSRVPIGLLPLGTANILAHELAIPKKPEAAAKAIEEGKVRWLDMGLANDHRFLMVASAGIDALVTQEVKGARGKKLGYWGYVLPVFRALARYRVPDLRVTTDDREGVHGAFVLVSNTKNYGGIFTFADRACCDSGHLDVCVFPGGTFFALVWYYFAALGGRVSKKTNVNYLTAKRVRIESWEPVPVQVDGDVFGTTPVHIEIRPSSVPIIVPRDEVSDAR